MVYEVIREIFNACSGNQMRDVFIDEIETEDTDAAVEAFLIGKDITCDKSELSDGSVVYDIVIDGLKQRISFTV